MKLILLIISLIFYGITAAQDSTFYNVVRDAVNSTGNTGTIFYADSAISFWGAPSRFAKKKKLRGYESITKSKQTSLALHKKELKSLDQQAKQITPILWVQQAIADSRRLTKDSLDTIAFNNRVRDGKKEKPVNYYYFSQPIYTRNRTILIFHLVDMIGHSAGHDFIFVYQLGKEGWKRKLVIWAGAF